MSSYEVEQSFRNLVQFYNKELMYVYKGEKATRFFSARQRKKLVKVGVFQRFYLRGIHLKLTKKAVNVLNSYMAQQV